VVLLQEATARLETPKERRARALASLDRLRASKLPSSFDPVATLREDRETR
jgi:hypothetical protein